MKRIAFAFAITVVFAMKLPGTVAMVAQEKKEAPWCIDMSVLDTTDRLLALQYLEYIKCGDDGEPEPSPQEGKWSERLAVAHLIRLFVLDPHYKGLLARCRRGEACPAWVLKERVSRRISTSACVRSICNSRSANTNG